MDSVALALFRFFSRTRQKAGAAVRAPGAAHFCERMRLPASSFFSITPVKVKTCCFLNQNWDHWKRARS